MVIAFDPSRHAELLAALGRAAEGIQAELDALEREVAGLRDRWGGDARDAFERAQAEWTAGMVVVQRVLREAARAADQAGRRLVEAEEEVVDLFQ